MSQEIVKIQEVQLLNCLCSYLCTSMLRNVKQLITAFSKVQVVISAFCKLLQNTYSSICLNNTANNWVGRGEFSASWNDNLSIYYA